MQAHVSDLKYWNNEVAQLYHIQSIPANLLIDPTGKIIARDISKSTFFIGGLQPQLVARREIIDIQLKTALNREAVGIAGQSGERIG